MNKHKSNLLLIAIMLLTLVLSSASEVLAMPQTTQIPDLGSGNIQKETNQLPSSQNTVTEKSKETAESLKAELEADLDKLNTQLVDLNTEYNEIEKKTEEKKKQITKTKEELEKTQKAKTTKQKEIETRIKNIYEAGELSYAEGLLTSAGITDFMNYIEQIKDITDNDRKMLQQYRAGQENLKQKTEQLQKEQKEIEQLQNSINTKKNKITTLINSASQRLINYEARLTEQKEKQGIASEPENAQETAQNFTKELIIKAQKKSSQQRDIELAEQRTVREQIEKAKAQEKKKDMDIQNTNQGETNRTPQSTATSPPTAATPDELLLLAAIIECEAGNQTQEGKIAVANVVLNRVKSKQFPNTIYGVIYQKGQFTPVDLGIMTLTLAKGPDPTCLEAAQQALNGTNYVGEALFFRTNNGRPGQVIGAHVFY